MDFKKFLPLEEEKSELDKEDKTERINQTQFYDIITSRKPDWQAIIYDLIHTEQLDPWDVDIILLTRRYFEKITELDDTDFYISSKVLLAAALLLRIKSEFLLNKHIKSIDEVLFGKKEAIKSTFERIEIDEDELPILLPKTPLPRLRKVTLPELMAALNKAINTESRRIKREVSMKIARKLSETDFPEIRRVDLKDRIKQIYARILTILRKKTAEPEKHLNKVSYSGLIGSEREERLAGFLPLLHLSNTKKLWLEQESHLEEIWIYLYEFFNKNRSDFIEELEEDIEEMKKELEGNSESIEGEKISNLEKARVKLEAKKKLEEEIRKELEEELKTEIKQEISKINKEEKINKMTGFEDEII